MHYHIIENTPGYMPDSDEDYSVESVEDAKAAILEVVEEWRDDRAQLDGETEDIGVSEDGLSAWMTDRSDYMHDLGRVVEAALCAEADCAAFCAVVGADIEGRESDAAHDLWLTRNGHGAGFWDGDWPEPAATRMTDYAHALGETDVYAGDDGRLYIS